MGKQIHVITKKAWHSKSLQGMIFCDGSHVECIPTYSKQSAFWAWMQTGPADVAFKFVQKGNQVRVSLDQKS